MSYSITYKGYSVSFDGSYWKIYGFELRFMSEQIAKGYIDKLILNEVYTYYLEQKNRYFS